MGGAAAKDVDTSISAGDTSTDVPTTAAVASFVEGKNYVGSTGSTGDLLYWSNTNTTSHLAAGTNGQVLTLSNGVPSWGSASGNQVVIIPVTYSSYTYSITYTYDELKALIVAGKIVVLAYNTEFYYQRHDNNIGSDSNPTLQFNSLNVSGGTQYCFYITKNTSTGVTNIYRSNNYHSDPIIFQFYDLIKNGNNYFIDDLYDVASLTTISTQHQTILREKLTSQSDYSDDYRYYFISKITYEDEEYLDTDWTRANIEYINIVELNNSYVIRKVFVSGLMYYSDDTLITVTVTDTSIGGNAVTSITPGNGLINGTTGSSQAAITSTGTISIKEGGVTNAMLAGSISNDKIANHTITINNVTKDLGGSFTTQEIGAGEFEVVRLI